jgi:hypothetical protein
VSGISGAFRTDDAVIETAEVGAADYLITGATLTCWTHASAQASVGLASRSLRPVIFCAVVHRGNDPQPHRRLTRGRRRRNGGAYPAAGCERPLCAGHERRVHPR